MKSPTILLVLFALGAALSAAFGDPRPGDVFVEVGMPVNRTLQGDGGSTPPLSIPVDLDLAHATKAELVVEFANVHLGVSGQAARVNGHDWIPVPFPATVPALPCPVKPEGDQSHIYQMPAITIAVPLADLVAGTGNTCELMTPDKGENHKAFTQIYGVTLRVYYDPATKPHATGRVTSPAAGTALGANVPLAVMTDGKVRSVDYAGLYEDLDYNGDGVYRDWVCTRRLGQLAGHAATAKQEPFAATWDASWIPDQTEPMQLAARITDENGVTYMTPAVGGLTFARGYSVELCKPEGVINGFSTCTYGKPMTIYTAETRNKTQWFNLTTPADRIVDARLYFACWRRRSGPQMTINGNALTDIVVEGGGSQYITLPLRPLSSLVSGKNELVLVNAKDGGTDIQWPGVQVLVRGSAP